MQQKYIKKCVVYNSHREIVEFDVNQKKGIDLWWPYVIESL